MTPDKIKKNMAELEVELEACRDANIQKKKKIAELEAQIRKLCEFVDYILQSESWGNIDGGDIQDKAVELELIELRPIDEEDSIDGEKEHYFTKWTPIEALAKDSLHE